MDDPALRLSGVWRLGTNTSGGCSEKRRQSYVRTEYSTAAAAVEREPLRDRGACSEKRQDTNWTVRAPERETYPTKKKDSNWSPDPAEDVARSKAETVPAPALVLRVAAQGATSDRGR